MFYDLIDSNGAVLQSRIRLTPHTPALKDGQKWRQTTSAAPANKPIIVSIFQATEALAAAGFLDTVEAYFASASATATEKRAWKRISQVNRNSPLMAKLATKLSLTDEQIDALFIAAATIEA